MELHVMGRVSEETKGTSNKPVEQLRNTQN